MDSAAVLHFRLRIMGMYLRLISPVRVALSSGPDNSVLGHKYKSNLRPVSRDDFAALAVCAVRIARRGLDR